MKKYITVDGGTTNTRIRLISNKKIIFEAKIKMGAGDKNSVLLSESVRDGINDVIKKSGCQINEITGILACGMITSEFGIYNVPHIEAPAGVKELGRGIKQVILDNIVEIPINFIPGVKKHNSILCRSDMMRGEECEFFGISELENIKKNALVILPGSHTKIIASDNNGRIADFSTSLTGEMIAAISGNTILSDAINLGINEFDEGYLKNGYEYCNEYGLNEALFKVRILKNMYNADEKSRYSFFMGSVLCGDVKRIAEYAEKDVYVGGKKQIKDALFRLLKDYTDKNVFEVSEENVDISVSAGMIYIYEQNKATEDDLV